MNATTEQVTASVSHFLRLVKQGRHRGCSSGERHARRLAFAVLESALGLDDQATEGLKIFIDFARSSPNTMREMVERGQE